MEGAVEVHGTLSPRDPPGSMNMNIDGDLNLQSDGLLVIEIAGVNSASDYDVLIVSGIANLAATLEIKLVDGFVPGDTDTFDFLSALG